MKYQRSLFLLYTIVALAATATARPRHSQKAATKSSDSIVAFYTEKLEQLVAQREAPSTDTLASPSPYLFRLFAPGTVYTSALAQNMGYEAQWPVQPEHRGTPSLGPLTDSQLRLNEEINDHLNRAYTQMPQLFTTTQSELDSGSPLRSDLAATVAVGEVKLAEKVKEEALELNMEPQAVEPELKKPNFWKFKGNGSLQFTQNYFSDNWYQGGEKNYTMLTQFFVEANYDNQQKLQWDNKLEAQLGFQTSENTKPKFRATSNTLRLTSKVGYKAASHWNYASQLQLETQPYMNYDKNGEAVTADILSPLYARVSVGMDYKLKLSRFEGSLYLSPISYVLTYVDRDGLIGRYGINEGHHTKHEWGPNVNMTFTYKMWTNVSWTSRLYWFSTFELTRIEWENTLNFTINKYLSSKLFLYPRFDDSSIKYKDEKHGRYWMFKEWLSLGLNYDF